ncbi:hypothetical protein BJ138DRAFT_1167418 [Hygrophoropsis aurantiaca]|uniref:Uncharacterized protein n=1 Tax=Hygrophoropsis aurantiaca TaxID=72124 RepID=A0ACB7ZTB3_9AGAM|nr:hypothetical protein BJ138DRAFT_1167418 [Hygrophoropsis aurantiaca]
MASTDMQCCISVTEVLPLASESTGTQVKFESAGGHLPARAVSESTPPTAPPPPEDRDAAASAGEHPTSKPSTPAEPRKLSPDELASFKDTERLHGQRFLLPPDTRDTEEAQVAYEVIGYARARDRSLRYDVLFDDCEDPIHYDEAGMRRIVYLICWLNIVLP